MRNTFTIRLSDDLFSWLREISHRTGTPIGQIVRDHLEEGKAKDNQKFLRHAGAISGPADLSSRKGFSRK